MTINDDNSDFDFGYLKNNLIATLPDKYEKVEDKDELVSPQEVIDDAYDAFIQGSFADFKCKYFNELNGVNLTKNDVARFLRLSLLNTRLQKNNVLISNDLYNQVMSIKKTNICDGYFQRKIDEKYHQVNFSTMESCCKNNKFYGSILNTIEFKFEEVFNKNLLSKITEETYLKFEKMFKEKAMSNDIKAIRAMADLVNNFSIHKFYLPYGPASPDDSCLLLRYDHTSDKHKNGVLPKLYKNVYPQEVNEPHFHFTRGFGSVYKLTNKMNTEDFGVGYAIGITDLENYLLKLENQDFKNDKEQQLYMENDFGMPFLNIYKSSGGAKNIENLREILELMKLTYAMGDLSTGDSGIKLILAYSFMELCSGVPEKQFDPNLYFKNPYLTDVRRTDLDDRTK